MCPSGYSGGGGGGASPPAPAPPAGGGGERSIIGGLDYRILPYLNKSVQATASAPLVRQRSPTNEAKELHTPPCPDECSLDAMRDDKVIIVIVLSLEHNANVKHTIYNKKSCRIKFISGWLEI